jgi:hypothetical protein
MNRAHAIGLAGLIALSAMASCKKDDNTAATTTASSTSVASAPVSAAPLTAMTTDTPATTADIDNLPAPTAQATAAAKTVTTTNYKTQLDSLEKEINGIK